MTQQFLRTSFALLTACALNAAAAVAQTTPEPAATSSPAAVQSEAPTVAPTPMHSLSTPSPKPQYKKLKTATLSTSQLTYALTHQVSEAKQLTRMKKINFDNLRIVKLSGPKLNLLQRLHIRVDSGEQTLAYDPFLVADTQQVIAQATSAPPLPTTNGNNSPIQYLRDVLANINVSNALNNLLNNSTVSATVSLSNVLNNNKIAIGQVVGIYIGGGGLINTIIK